MKTKVYKKPVGAHIARSRAPRLYRIEHMRDVDLKENARAIGEVLGFTEEQYWTHSLPEALLNTLDTTEIGAAVVAAIAFLEMKGCQVYPPAEGFRFEIMED